MYAEFASDPKVQMLSETDQHRYIMLLCLRCGNGNVTLHDEEVCFQLRINDNEWQISKSVFLSKNLIDDKNFPTAWERRQFSSDSSVERVRRFRNKQKDGAKQERNVTVTPPETETEKEYTKPSCSSAVPNERVVVVKSKGNRKQPDERFAEFWKRYPRKVAKSEAEKAWMSAHINGEFQQLLDALDAQKRTEQWAKDGGQFVPYASTWIRQRRWMDETGTARAPNLFGGAL